MYRQHRDRWVRLAYAVAGHRRHAEDAVAEAVAQVWPRYRDGRVDDVARYVTRSVVNEAMAQGRRLGVGARALARRSPAPDGRAVDDAVEHHQLVVDGLFRLPPGQRAAIALRFLDDLSEAETASMLGVSVGTVKSRVHRGLRTLRALMEEVVAGGR